ncbi:MAG: tail fiber domain-containing protein, partial [Bacteroidaceae bacterium]|nr:tail fiber domain-containing protein [Bacteroidaceae bacterium]
KGDVTENNLANKTENTTGNVVVNTTGTTTETKVGNVTENHSGTTTDNNKGNVTVNNQANFTMNTSGTTTFTTTGDTVIHSDGAVGITAVEDIVATSSESSIIVTANDDLCETAGDVAAFKGVNKTNVGIDCSDAGQTTTLNLNGTTINETGTTVNISGSTAANVSGATVVVSGNTTNVSGATTLNLSGKTVNVDATDIDVDASNNYCLSAATKANIYGKETNIGVECGGTTATTINVSGTTINEGGTTLNENFQDYDINASKTYCVSAATNANFYGKETNIGVDCGGTTATTINVSGTTINEGGTTNNNNFTTINNTATTINNKTTNFNVTGTTYISGDTTISGTTTIGNTLIIKEGLEKKLSWSYGDVKSAASGSTNFKSDASFVIPKCVSDINRKKLKITHNGNGDASYDPGSDCDNAETTITLTHKTLSTKYGENVTGRTNTDFNTSADETIYIPTSVKNLSNWNGTCYEFDGPLCITGTVTASGAIYSSDKNLKENIKSIDAEDINKVGAIDLKSFNFIDDESKTKVYGVIAQEVQEAGLDILVHQKEDGMLGVDYTSFLILKIAQLQRDNNNLVNFVASLDKRVKELEEKLEKKD